MSEALSMSVLHIKQELDATTPTAAGTATTTTNATCYSPSTPNSSHGLNRSNSYSNGTSSSTNSGGGGGSRNYNANVDRHTPSTTSSTSNGGGSTANGCLKSSPSVSPERQQCSSTTHSLELGNNKIQISIGSASQNGGSQATSSAAAPSSGGSIRDELRRLCLVCGDVASGFHYGVASCEACKAFFKRTIQGNIEYTCPANNECEINKRRRKACQACRFQKCLRMGMLKEGVRLDRVRGGRQKYRRNPVSNSYQTMQLLYQSNTASLGDVKILEVLNAYEPDTLTVQQHPTTTLQTSSPNDQPHTTATTTNEDDLRASMKNENSSTNSSSNTSASSANSAQNTPSTTPTTPTAPASAGAGATTPSSTAGTVKATPCIFQNNNNEPHEILCVLSDLYDKELVLVIGWAKQIPGFTELPLNDQMKLLQVSWTELLTLQVCFRSLPFNGKLCFATDVWLDELLAKECGYIEFYYHCVQIAQRLERISPRREEYYLLKALLLANCDILLDDQSSLRAFRDTILNSFNDVVYLLRHSAAVTHQQHLMLVLPSLRQADEILRRFWRRICRDETVTMKKLFVEMLEPVAR